MRWFTAFLIVVICSVSFPTPSRAASVAQNLSGYIALQVEKNGEAWYVYPKDLRRYYLGRPDDAFSIMRRLGLGITNANLAKIPVAGSSDVGDAATRSRLSGYILIQVEKNGEAWYVYPKTKTRYYLGRPSDAYTIMRNLGVGISNVDLDTIPADVGITQGSRSVTVSGVAYTVDYLSFDRKNPAIAIMTDTGNNGDCTDNCYVTNLANYVARRGGSAGIHGTYFCPGDYASCAGKTGSYFYPIYNSFSKVMVNDHQIKFTGAPMVAFDAANKPYYYHQAVDFKNKTTFESTTGQTLQAAMSNAPAMVEGGQNVLDVPALDSKQATAKSYRGAFAWKGDNIYLLVVRGATVIDSAGVMTAMGMDYAINLDGGGSTALYNSGHYIIGPGRNIPNAIVITPRQ